MNKHEPSLLFHLNEIRSKAIPEGGLSNIIVCGKMKSETDTQDVMDLHRMIVESEVNEEKCNVTGLLLVQGITIMHFLEGPSDAIQRILSKLSTHKQFQANNNNNSTSNILPTQSGRVVYSIEDRPTRLYPEWYSCVLQERKDSSEEINSENCKDIVFELSTKVIEIGKRVANEFNREDLEISKYRDQLPGKGLVLALGNSDLFWTIQEYTEAYIAPYHVEIESEQTWPLESIVKYY